MPIQFVTTKVFNQLLAVAVKNQGLTMQVGGLASDVDWGNAYPNKNQGNNLNVVLKTGSSTEVTIKAGSIWSGGQSLSLTSDANLGPFATSLPAHLYAVNAGGAITVSAVSSFTPTPPVNTIKEIAVAYTSSSGKVFQIVTIPSLINQIATASASVALVGWNKLTPASSGPFNASNPTNAIQVTAQFDFTGSYKIGEFGLTLGSTNLISTGVPSPSYLMAYYSQDTQIVVLDALFNVTWNLILNEPTAFY